MSDDKVLLPGKSSTAPPVPSALIDFLENCYPPLRATVKDLATEEGRLRYAIEVGKREMIEIIKLQGGGK